MSTPPRNHITITALAENHSRISAAIMELPDLGDVQSTYSTPHSTFEFDIADGNAVRKSPVLMQYAERIVSTRA